MAPRTTCSRTCRTRRTPCPRSIRPIRRASRPAAGGDRIQIAHVLAGQQGGDPGDATEAVDRLSRRDDLRRSLAEARAAYAAAGCDFGADALAAEEAERDPVRTDTLRAEVDEADLRKEELRDARSAAKATLDAALAGEGGVAPDQERAALVEALRQGGARRWRGSSGSSPPAARCAASGRPTAAR